MCLSVESRSNCIEKKNIFLKITTTFTHLICHLKYNTLRDTVRIHEYKNSLGRSTSSQRCNAPQPRCWQRQPWPAAVRLAPVVQWLRLDEWTAQAGKRSADWWSPAEPAPPGTTSPEPQAAGPWTRTPARDLCHLIINSCIIWPHLVVALKMPLNLHSAQPEWGDSTWLSSRTRLFSSAGGQPSSGSPQAASSLSRGWRTAVCCSKGCWDWPMSISNSFSSAPWLSGSRPRRRCHWTRRSRIFSVTTISSMGPMGCTLAAPSGLSAGRSSASRHNIWSVLFLTAVRSSLEDEGSCCSNTQDTWRRNGV